MEGRVDFDDKLSPNEYTAIYGGNLKRSEDQTRFSFFNLDENRQLLVPEKKKVYLRNLTRFQLEMSYFRISRINLSRGSRFNPIGFYNIFTQNYLSNFSYLKPQFQKRNCTMFILKIFLSFFFFNIQKFFLIDDYIASKICLAFQVEFGVHFQIDLKKTKVKKEEKSNYCHVALIKLMLGSATLQDFIMICSIN